MLDHCTSAHLVLNYRHGIVQGLDKMVTRCLPRAETAALELTQDFKGFRLFGVWPLALPYHVIMLHRSFLAKAAARAQAMAIETRLAMNPLQLDPIRHSSV
jgi:hypothetical protein